MNPGAPAFGDHLYDRLVQTAAEAWLERGLHRLGGYDRVGAAVAEDPDGEGLWLHEFAGAFMREWGLDGPDGCLWVLAHTFTREVPGGTLTGGRVREVVADLARRCFASDVLARARRDLERKVAFGW